LGEIFEYFVYPTGDREVSAGDR